MSQNDLEKTPSSTSTDSSSLDEELMDGMQDPDPLAYMNETGDMGAVSMDEMMGQDYPDNKGSSSSELDVLPAEEAEPDEPELATSPDGSELLPQVGSTTLSQLPDSRRPEPSTVCQECPASMWYAMAASVKCYCRIMHLISWSTEEPVAMTHCDGIAIASAEAEE